MYVQAPSKNWVGWRLNKNIYSRHGHLLLPEYALLTERRIQSLDQHQIKLNSDDVIPVENRSKELIQQAICEVKQIFDYAQETGQIPIAELQATFIPQIEQIVNTPGLLQILIELQELDDYTYQHNVAVGVIATLIGKWLDYDEASLTHLSLAASLHDIGKVRISADILNKPGKLTVEEFEQMKLHTNYGYELILQSVGASERMAAVALQHHEREDGSGYPDGIKGSAMDPMSKIVAVADVFHAMTSKRVYKDATPFYLVLKRMKDKAYGFLDPCIVTLFMRKVMDSLIGCHVLLSDGTKGVIVMNQHDDPANPLVRVGYQFIDLSQELELNIEHILSN